MTDTDPDEAAICELMPLKHGANWPDTASMDKMSKVGTNRPQRNQPDALGYEPHSGRGRRTGGPGGTSTPPPGSFCSGTIQP
jgi:hypothetical protein